MLIEAGPTRLDWEQWYLRAVEVDVDPDTFTDRACRLLNRGLVSPTPELLGKRIIYVASAPQNSKARRRGNDIMQHTPQEVAAKMEIFA